MKMPMDCHQFHYKARKKRKLYFRIKRKEADKMDELPEIVKVADK
jgi:hypothetical protein